MSIQLNDFATRREQAKAERRLRIVQAATSLLRDVDYDTISMNQIADRAGVSPKTLYNLFESRAAIFKQVFDNDLSSFRALIEKQTKESGLERVFAAILKASHLYRQDPNFYRAMARINDSTNDGMRSAITLPRHSFWSAQFEAAAEQGQLLPGADVTLLSASVSNLITGTFLDWAAGRISSRQFARTGTFGVASLLLPHASRSAADMVKARITNTT